MGVAPYKTFTFDGVSSSVYGVYLTGEGVFNAPQRAVELIEIPGRNGNYALDQGKFNNISVTYKVGMFDVDESNFATKVSNFRNWLCSKVGYKRLTDEYNANEYRMAVYASGFELDHDLLIAGEAEITFDCKPQRFLTSGETATAVANNGTISNPTLFESSPLLQIWGYGNIHLGGDDISVIAEPIGTVQCMDAVYNIPLNNLPYANEFDNTWASSGDLVYEDYETYMQFQIRASSEISSFTASYDTSAFDVSSTKTGSKIINGTAKFKNIQFNYGTSTSFGGEITFSLTMSDSTTKTVKANLTYTYNGTKKVTVACPWTYPSGFSVSATITMYELFLDSSQSSLGSPLYFDLDIGEAYKISGDSVVSVNNGVSFPAKLPTLKPGSNTITYDNTITQFKITPRWWKV